MRTTSISAIRHKPNITEKLVQPNLTMGTVPSRRSPPLMQNLEVAFDAKSMLEGKWHVISTTFPMWLSGDKLLPQFNYSKFSSDAKQDDQEATKSDVPLTFDDVVTYSDTKFREHSIYGYDTQNKEIPTAFTWTGKGALFFFQSQWDVIAMGQDQQGHPWAVITFEPTIATPAGMDIISRQQKMSQEEIDSIMKLVEENDPVAAVHLPHLKPVFQM